MSRHPQRLTDVLQSGGFAVHARVGKILGLGFSAQCYITSVVFASMIVAASIADKSLVLPGSNVGLLEHPAIWAFLCLQVALPVSIAGSLVVIVRARARIRSLLPPKASFSRAVVGPILRFVRLRDAESRTIAAFVYLIGLTAFVWNTYQNQRPYAAVSFDFWDSTTYPFGFWVTRLYKFYLFVVLLPYMAIVHIGILTTLLRLIRRSRLSGDFNIAPFHPDGVGGLGFVPPLVATPVVVALLAASIPMAAAFEVHRALDVTPIIGLFTVLTAISVAYVAPTFVLRCDIIAMKKDLVRQLRLLQQTHYNKIIGTSTQSLASLQEGNEALDYFDKVCARVQAISNYPHLRRVINYAGIALTPSVLSFLWRAYGEISPFVRPLLSTH